MVAASASKLTMECRLLSNLSRFFRKFFLNSAVFLTEKVQISRSGFIRFFKYLSALLVTAPYEVIIGLTGAFFLCSLILPYEDLMLSIGARSYLVRLLKYGFSSFKSARKFLRSLILSDFHQVSKICFRH